MSELREIVARAIDKHDDRYIESSSSHTKSLAELNQSRADAALSALRAEGALVEWNTDMEAAPKDGTRVLLWSEPLPGYIWDDMPGVHIGHYSAEREGWILSAGPKTRHQRSDVRDTNTGKE